jgi:hypothetical protein
MKRQSFARSVAAIATFLLSIATPRPAAAQSVESDVTDESSHLVKVDEHYGIPDVGEGLLSSAS